MNFMEIVCILNEIQISPENVHKFNKTRKSRSQDNIHSTKCKFESRQGQENKTIYTIEHSEQALVSNHEMSH